MNAPSLQEIFGSYTAWKADDKTWFINFMNGSQNMYLLEGEEKALLIDTGFGAGNLREFVEKLTDKPILVANTHFHPDHSAGNGEFESVYVSESYSMDESSVTLPGVVPFDIKKMPYPDYKKVLVKEGDVIDLGNRKIEIIEVKPAHCNSSIFFLDRKHKMFFTGDELEAAQVNMFDNSKNPELFYDVKERLENFKKNNQRILEFKNEFELLLPNHNGFPISKSYITDYIELVDNIFMGYAKIEDKLNHPFIEMDPVAPKLCRVRWNHASIFILKEEVLKVYGSISKIL